MPIRTSIVIMACTALSMFSASVHALTDKELAATLEARLRGDRTGVCVVAAAIDGKQVSRAKYCAKPRANGGPSIDDAFEIGSISKTMTAFLVADLVKAGQWSLDDPIAKHLPPGTVVPRQGERQILVRDLLTHSSGLPGLPPGFQPSNPADPYAGLTELAVLASLAKVQLTRPIGGQAEYSNFGMMVVSAAVSRTAGGDIETALKSRLFVPLKMAGAYVAKPPAGVALAQGHTSWGVAAPPWTIAPTLAGFGMVKATLADMVAYAQAELGVTDTPLAATLRTTQQPLAHGFAMNWIVTPIAGHDVVFHEGGTGGYSAIVALEPARRRAAVVLADTALTDLGGVGDLGLALLGIDKVLGKPRLAQPIPAALRAAIQGDYDLPGLHLVIADEGGRLLLKPDGQGALELFYDHGDLYPEKIDALLIPEVAEGPVKRFIWRQGGGAIPGERRAAPGAK